MATKISIPIEVYGPAVFGFGEDAKSLRILNLGPGHVYLRSIHVLVQEKHSSLSNQPEEPGPLRFGQSPQLLEPGQEIELLTFQSVEKMTTAYDGLAGLVTRESITREIPFTYTADVTIPGERKIIILPPLKFVHNLRDPNYVPHLELA